MAQENSFDIVSKVDIQEVRNAIDQALKEIKATLGVSESRVSQIHAQAVIHLRAKLRALRGDLGYREGDPTVKQKYTRRNAG